MRKQDLNSEMTRIYNTHGELTASLVLSEATPEESPLHNYFEWDDGKAGHQYRLIQSRRLIRVSRVTYQGREEELYHIRTVSPGGDGREGVYRPVSAVVASVSDFTTALMEVEQRLNATKAAYERLKLAARKEDRGDETLSMIMIAVNAVQLASNTLKQLH